MNKLKHFGKLISFEGIDGAGKSTVINGVAKQLRAHGKHVVIYQEPGTTPMGQSIRQLLKSDVSRSALSELLLFEASRADMISNVIVPNLETNDYILLDRFIDSTVAYQGYGNGQNLALIHELNQIATQQLYPDYRFLIDIDLKTAKTRRYLRDNHDNDKFDNSPEYAKRVYDGYQKLVETDNLIAIPNHNISKTVRTIVQYLLTETGC